jgi:hypothetical protein
MTGNEKQTGLDTTFRLGKHGDDVYAVLIAAHRGLAPDESNRLNARLVLLLANHIGDASVVIDAIHRARTGIVSTREP